MLNLKSPLSTSESPSTSVPGLPYIYCTMVPKRMFVRISIAIGSQLPALLHNDDCFVTLRDWWIGC